MTKKPDFLIVGAAKAGTTSLYYYLQQHPDIWFPKLKETKYFSSKIKPYPQNGIGDWSIDRAAITKSSDYYNLFKSCPDDMIKGEASPDYLLFSKDLAPIIKEELGDIPIIISIRNPIYRAFSAYSNLLRDNREVLNFKILPGNLKVNKRTIACRSCIMKKSEIMALVKKGPVALDLDYSKSDVFVEESKLHTLKNGGGTFTENQMKNDAYKM